MTKRRSVFLGACAALVASAGIAIAGPSLPTGAVQMPAAEGDSLVTKIQAMCRDGWGNWVPCRALRRGPPPAPYYAPPPRRYNPAQSDRCVYVYNQCYAAYGRGSPAYFGCMRSRGC